ncbi:MAG: PAS domain-containing sensor histidine kinase [Anaerolineae bacterium]|nr:PAS domain-containing sensor histidine kinase [Anaerolineae bacterium]
MSDDKQIEQLNATIDQLQRDLAHAQENYHNLFENIGDSLFIIDLDTYKIITVNDHTLRRFGYTQAELVGKGLDDLEVSYANPRTQELAWESSFSGTRVYECYYRHRDNSLVPVEVSSRVVRMNGRDVIQNFVRNIKVRKQMEAERQQLIEDLDSFAHTVAHDLKNPLSVITSYAHFLHETFQFMSPEELRDGFDFLHKEGKRTITIVEELLLFASVQGQGSVEYAPLDMYTIVTDAKSRLAYMIHQAQTQIIVPEKWDLAVGYAPWVQEIWVNYISNAIKYGGKPPHVQLGSELEANGMVRFWVKDNGAGIPAQDIPNLFSQFTQLKNMRVDGHGLGLSIVKRIAERLGGGVDVESALGKGSVFSFRLPAYHP